EGSVIESVSIGTGPGAAKSQVLFQQTLRLPFGPEEGRLTPTLNEAWLADATLVRLHLEPMAKFTRQLTAANLKLNEQNRSAFLESQTNRAVDLTIFANVSLPNNADKAQVRSYIKTILILSQRQNTFSSADPQVGLLRRVGADNLDVLIDASSGANPNGPFRLGRSYVDMAIPDLVRPEDKALILGALPAHPWLIDLVVERGWQGEVRGVLLAAIEDSRQKDLPVGWIKAVASFKDPSTYPALKAYVVRGSQQASTVAAIRELPGIDLSDTVDLIWRNVRSGPVEKQIEGAAAVAAFGRLEALAALVAALKRNDYDGQQAAYWIKQLTPATGDNAALIAWFEANRSRLVFDPAQKKFLPRPQP
ncbi:MAG: hypothetical protein ABIY47_03485, partial [Opitutaceae bacterium]